MLVFLIVSLLITMISTLTASAAVSSGVTYNLINVNSGKYLDVQGVGTVDGSNVQIWGSADTVARRWTIFQNSDGTFKLINPNSGKALDVNAAGTANGSNVQIWSDNGTGAQKWWLDLNADGSYTLVNLNADKALDVSGAGTADGTNVQIWTKNGTAAQKWWIVPASSSGGGGGGGGFAVSEAQFNQMFPNRSAFYTYQGLVTAANSFAGFATTGDNTIKKREIAAFLANVNHESDQLRAVREYNTANYSHYCDWGQSYGCPAGQSAYYGKGPIQLSWNFNYKAAGDYIGVNLLNNPELVATDAAIAWKTAIWYWMSQNGPGWTTPHNAMVNSNGFGETIRSINGSLECNNANPAQVQARVDAYLRFTQILGVTAGSNLYC
ncbi:putative chitinase [Cohnella lupini]|uniref:Putative chitinase n=2 Tax=Cohnella lupini TaxID=1294267 RepID=A0A3D9ICK8_9BACL|nr:putative chitinase [Cohnella lupini]